MASIILDIREPKLHTILKPLTDIPITTQALDVADIQIHTICNDKEIRIYLERKTLSDFIASIKDGRYKEQKFRLKSASQPQYVAYILEDVPNVPQLINTHVGGGLPSSGIISAILHTCFRDGFHVFFSSSLNETAQWIIEIAKRLNSCPEKFIANEEYINHIKGKTKKSHQIDIPLCQTMMLMQIPGISSKLGKLLIEKFGTVNGMIKELSVLDEKDRYGLLQTIPLLGPKKSKVLLEYLLT